MSACSGAEWPRPAAGVRDGRGGGGRWAARCVVQPATIIGHSRIGLLCPGE